MSLIPPTIVLFDMDGTTVRHLHPRLLQILEALDDASHKAARFFSRTLKTKIDAPPLVETRHGKRPKLLVHRAMHKMRRKDVDEIVEPCPGIYDVLDFLKSRNIRMGIVSNGLGKGYGHDILKTFDLEPYFNIAIFREDIRRSKPWPDPLLQALNGLDTPPGQGDVVWYIGDRRKDIQAALAAREHLPCPVVPIAYGLNAAIAVLENNVGNDNIIMAWADLMPRLRQSLQANH
ncbi:MAG: HAD-IA family hydrolase [Micavibrio aeruginosavorus]|uniref:phosphoglycolate phosphatase n=1 Tax=Micavibrio aeruginosavorus TaxID=349221 RepID=A0A7T5UIX6_9BACT|nr:MAG: HAD-IA family hydrolase [Micavibrio aeruginosavorus]